MQSSESKRARLGAWLFAWALFGYPIIGVVSALLQQEGNTLSVAFRLAIAAASLWAMASPGAIRMDRLRLSILIFWTAFGCRLVFDAINGVEEAPYALQFFIFSSMLPTLGLWKLDAFDAKRYARASFIVSSIGCIAALLGAFAQMFGDADLSSAVGRLSLKSLNPVTLGFLAASGLISGIVIWPHTPPKQRWILRVVLLLLLWTLLLTGSKGPALGLVALLLLFAWRQRSALNFGLSLLGIASILLLFERQPLIERLFASQEDQSTADRMNLLADSLSQIMDSPWIGSSFVETESGSYAHCLLLEAPMALGIPLAMALFSALTIVAHRSIRGLSGSQPIFELLYLQGLLGLMASGSMYGATMTWASLVAVLYCNPTRRRLATPSPIAEDLQQIAGKPAPVDRPHNREKGRRGPEVARELRPPGSRASLK